MLVRAVKDGFYGGYRRRKDEVFDFNGKKLGKWMVPVNAEIAEVKPKKEPKTKGPETLLDIAKDDSKALEVKGAEGLL
jgi:hypothetical protein